MKWPSTVDTNVFGAFVPTAAEFATPPPPKPPWLEGFRGCPDLLAAPPNAKVQINYQQIVWTVKIIFYKTTILINTPVLFLYM